MDRKASMEQLRAEANRVIQSGDIYSGQHISLTLVPPEISIAAIWEHVAVNAKRDDQTRVRPAEQAMLRV